MSEKKDYEKQTFGLSTDLIDYLIMMIMTVTMITAILEFFIILMVPNIMMMNKYKQE